MKTLYIFSLYTPIGQGEVFLKNEIDLWLKEENIKLIVVPTSIEISEFSIIPDYVDVTLSEQLSKRSLKKFKMFLNPINIFKCFSAIPMKHIFNINVFRESFDALAIQKITKDWVKRLDLTENTVFYSFWLTNIILSVAKYFNKSDIKVIARTHRFDLYDYTQKYNFFPFRDELISNLDLLMPASLEAYNYLIPKFGDKVKIHLKKLGVNTSNEILVNKDKNMSGYRIVSCSYIRKVKRVELIAERLIEYCRQNPKIKIEWVHFGKGELEKDVLSVLKTRPLNLKFKINDFTPNEELLKFYQSNWIDVFINLSSSEGQPVSIMEAMAYGIPCLATDTGGVGELINEMTGLMLKVHHQKEEFNSALSNILFKTEYNRNKIKEFIIHNNSLDKQFNEILEVINK